MKFDILTLFPDFFPPVLNSSILGRAVDKGILDFKYINIRDFSKDKHKKVDDYPYGGGLGMIMQPQPIFDAYNSILFNSEKKPATIYLSPRGKVFNQKIANELSQKDHIVLICGHYEGIDQRIIDEICDYELSIGDFVLTGGEIAAMVVCDSVGRLVPGVLSYNESFTGESHYNGLLEHPQYTRPEVFNGIKVPDVLLSGNHKDINKWRDEKSLEITQKVRPDLLNFAYIPINKAEHKVGYIASKDELQNKGMEAIISQCKKLDIEIKEYNENEHYDSLFVLLDDDTEIKNVNFNGFIMAMSLCEDTQDYLKFKKLHIPCKNVYVPELIQGTPREIAKEIYDFIVICSTVKNIDKNDQTEKKIIDSLSEFSYTTDILNNIPYDLYENNIQKFCDYEKNDLYLIDDVTKEKLDITIFKITENSCYIAQGEVIPVKSKKYGRLNILAIKDMNRLVRHIFVEKCFNQSTNILLGKKGKVLFEICKFLEIENIYFNLPKDYLYNRENPFINIK